MSKSDLTGGSAGADRNAAALWERFPDRVSLSAESGEGMDALASLVGRMFIDGSLSPETDAVVQNARQYAALGEALGAIIDAEETLSIGYSPDIAGISLEEALSALRSVDGRGVCAEVVDNIFSKFCVGK